MMTSKDWMMILVGAEMKRIVKVTLFLLLGLLCSVEAQTQTRHQAIVKGNVTDGNDAVVPNMPVVFTDDIRTYKVTTDKENGEYKITLDPGKYKVSVGGAFGFDVTYRSEILLDPDSRKTLNLEVFGKQVVLDTHIDQGEDEVREHPGVWPYGYEELPALSTVGVSSGMIRYAVKCQLGRLSLIVPHLFIAKTGLL